MLLYLHVCLSYPLTVYNNINNNNNNNNSGFYSECGFFPPENAP